MKPKPVEMSLFLNYQIVLLIVLFQTATSYNLDETSPVIKNGVKGSLFGLSLSLHHIKDLELQAEYDRLKNNKTAPTTPTILIGAPKADSLAERSEVGALYRCPITTDKTDCEALKIDERKDGNIPTVGQWLGVTVQSEKIGGKVAVCAHRWNGYTNDTSNDARNTYYDALFGKCYILHNDLTKIPEFSPLKPCSEFSGQLRIDNQQYCQAGMSLAFSTESGNENQAYYGMPGSFTWTGSVTGQDVNTDFFTNAGWESIGREELKNNKIGFNSYLGFAVATGSYDTSKNKTIIAVGAPRANGNGSVIIFNAVKNQMDFDDILTGELVASAYGYAVEVFDVNGDGWQDLIVGAPQYYDRINKRGGAVYVYLSNGSRKFGPEPSQILYGEVDSAFGNSIVNCGDLDMDGVFDVAIGAPHAKNGAGIVYIYSGIQGSLTGLQEEPSQVILGSTLQEKSLVDRPFSGFGYSLSGGLDMDENGYPDLLIGSLSDSAVLYRTRPIVNIDATVKTSSNVIKFSPKDTASQQAFQVTVCMAYSSIPEFNETMSMKYTLLLDTVNRVNERRVTFTKNGNQDTYESTLSLESQNENSCSTIDVYVKRTVVDKLSPLNIKLEYEVNDEDTKSAGRRKRDLPSEILFPILNKNSENYEAINLNISKNCGEDDVCHSNLEFTAEYVEQLIGETDWTLFRTNEAGVPLLVMAKEKQLGIRFTVTNTGEGAHQANLTVSLPYGLDYGRISPDQKIHSASDNYVNVNLGNPFTNGSSVEFILDFSGNKSLSNGDKIATKIELQTSSVQDEAGLTLDLDAIIRIEGHFEVLSNSQPRQMFPRGSVIGESAVEVPEDTGEVFFHSYDLKNKGRTNLQNVGFSISWPAQLENKKWLFYFVEYETDSSFKVDLNCNLPADLNPLGLSLTKPKEEAALRKKRDLAPEPVAFKQTAPNTRSSNANKTDIVCPNYSGCVEFNCTIREIPPLLTVVLKLHGVTWNSTFLEEYNKLKYTVQVASHFKLTNTEKSGVRYTDDSIKEATATTDVITEPQRELEQQTNIWVIATAALAGIILLVLLVLVLWCCGFFRRKRDFGGYHKARYHKQASKKAEESSQQMLYN